MAKTLFTYVEVVEKPANIGRTLHREDVSHLNKKGIEQRFVELEKIFDTKTHTHQVRKTAKEYNIIKAV